MVKSYHFASVQEPSKAVKIQGHHLNSGSIINLLGATGSYRNALGSHPSSVKGYQLSLQNV